MKNGKDLSGTNLESLGKSGMIFLNTCFHGIPRGQIKSLIKLTDSVSYLSDPDSKPPHPPGNKPCAKDDARENVNDSVSKNPSDAVAAESPPSPSPPNARTRLKHPTSLPRDR